MKNTIKFAALAAAAVLFAGCSSAHKAAGDDLAQLRASVEEARAAAVQSNQTSQQALALAQQNAARINKVFSKSQLK